MDSINILALLFILVPPILSYNLYQFYKRSEILILLVLMLFAWMLVLWSGLTLLFYIPISISLFFSLFPALCSQWQEKLEKTGNKVETCPHSLVDIIMLKMEKRRRLIQRIEEDRRIIQNFLIHLKSSC